MEPGLTRKELETIEYEITTQPRLSVHHELALAIAQAQLRKALWTDEPLLKEVERCGDTINQWAGLDYDPNSPVVCAVRDLREALLAARSLREGIAPWEEPND